MGRNNLDYVMCEFYRGVIAYTRSQPVIAEQHLLNADAVFHAVMNEKPAYSTICIKNSNRNIPKFLPKTVPAYQDHGTFRGYNLETRNSHTLHRCPLMQKPICTLGFLARGGLSFRIQSV